jgi:hypothetical protein
MADIAAKQSRAELLRQELAVLRVQHSTDIQEADQATLDVKLDDEIAQLERQVAIERERKASGGSVIDAMETMARAAQLEKEQAASLEAAAGSAVILVPAGDGIENTETGTEETVEDHSQDVPAPAAPAAGMGLIATPVTNGGNQ